MRKPIKNKSESHRMFQSNFIKHGKMYKISYVQFIVIILKIPFKLFHILKIQLWSNNITLNLSKLTIELHCSFSEIPCTYNGVSVSKVLFCIMLF